MFLGTLVQIFGLSQNRQEGYSLFISKFKLLLKTHIHIITKYHAKTSQCC